MNQNDVRLMNFLIDNKTKAKFYRACRSKQSNMTAELNRMIREYVSDQTELTFFERPLKWLISDGGKQS